jgi:hypothetical protein
MHAQKLLLVGSKINKCGDDFVMIEVGI